MPTTHKLYGGSNADIWVNCAGSTWLTSQVPRRPAGPAAQEGTAQHAVMEILLNDAEAKPEQFLGSTMLGVTLTKEHVAALQVALDAYMDVVEEYPEDAKLFAERAVDMSDEAGGTMDAGVVHGKKGAVMDFKFGQIEVDSEGLQGLFYGVCARKSEPSFANIDELDVIIIQPAYDPAIVKTTYPSGMLDRADQTFRNAIAASKRQDPIFTEGEWCTWCPAKLVCPKKIAGLETLTRPEHILDLDKLGETYLRLVEWQKWGDEAKERLLHELEHGRTNPYWKLVQKRAIRQWKDEAKTIVQFRRAKVDDDTFMPRKLVSPAQAEKGLLNKKAVAELAAPVSSGNTIAPMTDKRPPVLPTAALAAAVNRVK